MVEEFRDDKYDAYFCEHCGEWTEERCTDPDCDFCLYRPLHPDKKK